MKALTLVLALWLALCPLAHASVDQGVRSAAGWSIAKRIGLSIGGGVAGFAAGMGARVLLLRAIAGVALPAFAPALAGVLTVATITVAGVMVANWAYDAWKNSSVQAAAAAPTPAQAAGPDATDDATPAAPRPAPAGGLSLLGVPEGFPR